jgi:hypothetical protein
MKTLAEVFNACMFIFSLPLRCILITYIAFKAFNHSKRNEEILHPANNYFG